VVVDVKEIPCLRFISPMGIPCFLQAYEIVYIHGKTELKAQVRWMEEVRAAHFVILDPTLMIFVHRTKKNGTFPLTHGYPGALTPLQRQCEDRL